MHFYANKVWKLRERMKNQPPKEWKERGKGSSIKSEKEKQPGKMKNINHVIRSRMRICSSFSPTMPWDKREKIKSNNNELELVVFSGYLSQGYPDVSGLTKSK